MSQDPHASADQSILDMIENSPVGAVPRTPTYQDTLRRLYASKQVYASADFKDGHVTVRSLSKAPLFYASNLDALVAGKIDANELESDASIFARYLQSLPEGPRAKAESLKTRVVGRAVQHRKHAGAVEAPAIHDPVHTLFLVPGAGAHPGLPGNYLYGSMSEVLHPDAPATWVVKLHDAEDGSSSCELPSEKAAVEKLQEVISSAPFSLAELDALDFKAN
ncbi:MAG: hypothetical protein ABW223_08685 [Rariglobus sp.]